MEYITSLQTDKVEIEVYECTKCHFHIGLDFSFLDQVGDLDIVCPNCKKKFEIKGVN